MTKNDQMAQLRATRRGVEETVRVLALRWHMLQGQAEARTKADSHNFPWGRATTKWRLLDEVRFQAHLRQLVAAESMSLLALFRRLDRQLDAAHSQARILRLNEPWTPDPRKRHDTFGLWQLLKGGPGPVRTWGDESHRAAADPPKPQKPA